MLYSVYILRFKQVFLFSIYRNQFEFEVDAQQRHIQGGAMGAQPPPGKVKALIFRGVSAPNGG